MEGASSHEGNGGSLPHSTLSSPPSPHPTPPVSAPGVSGLRLNDSWKFYGLGFSDSWKD